MHSSRIPQPEILNTGFWYFQAERNPFASVVDSVSGGKGDELSSLTGSCFICAQRLTGTLDQPGEVHMTGV
jgi:hypothetical protein